MTSQTRRQSLLEVLVSTALVWMHFAIRRMDVSRHPQITGDTDLPEIMSQAGR